MLTLDNVATQDAFVAALTLESQQGGRLVYLVANASVKARYRPLVELGGSQKAEYGPEVLLTPQSGSIDRISAVSFRSAEVGKPARIVAQLSEPGDILPAAGTPFTQTLSNAGGVAVAGVLDRITSVLDIVGVNTEQTLYNFDMPAGLLGTNGILELRLGGDFLHNNAAADSLRLRIYLGPTGGALTPIYDTTDNLDNNLGAVSASRHPWDLYFRLQNLGLTNAQQWAGQLNIESVAQGSPTVGLGTPVQTVGSWLGKGGVPIALGPGAYAFDSTAPLTLRVTATWSVASGNDSFARRNGYLQVI